MSAHTTTLRIRYYAEGQITVLSEHPYSLDLAAANFFWFPKIKLKMKGMFSEDAAAIQSTCTADLKAIPQAEFSIALDGFYEHCHECICREKGSM